jgi:hypothetical protein
MEKDEIEGVISASLAGSYAATLHVMVNIVKGDGRAPPTLTRGRILGRKPDKSIKSFPPCYSESALQLCVEIFIIQNHATSHSFYSALLYTVKEKGGKPFRKPHLLPYG